MEAEVNGCHINVSVGRLRSNTNLLAQQVSIHISSIRGSYISVRFVVCVGLIRPETAVSSEIESIWCHACGKTSDVQKPFQTCEILWAFVKHNREKITVVVGLTLKVFVNSVDRRRRVSHNLGDFKHGTEQYSPSPLFVFLQLFHRKPRPHLTDNDAFIWSSGRLKERCENQRDLGVVHLQKGRLIPAIFDVSAGYTL